MLVSVSPSNRSVCDAMTAVNSASDSSGTSSTWPPCSSAHHFRPALASSAASTGRSASAYYDSDIPALIAELREGRAKLAVRCSVVNLTGDQLREIHRCLANLTIDIELDTNARAAWENEGGAIASSEPTWTTVLDMSDL